MQSPEIAQLLDDYAWGIVRLCTVFDTELEDPVKSRLVFANVELVAKGMAKPTTSGLDRLKLSKSRTLFFCHVAMSVEGALDWYRSASSDFRTPLPIDLVNNSKRDDLPFAVSALQDEPSWPILALHCPDEWPNERMLQFRLPFLADWNQFPRFHCRFSAYDAYLAEIAGDPSAATWLQNRLHFQISFFQEFLGGCFLIAPDPLIRNVRCKLKNDKEKGRVGETLIVHLEPRPFANLEGLTIRCQFARQVGLTERFCEPLGRKRIFQFTSNGVIAKSSIELECSKRGLLYASPLTPFFRDSAISSRRGQSRKTIVAPIDRKENSPQETRQVTVYSKPETIGLERLGDFDERMSSPDLDHLLSCLAQRDRKKIGMRLDQKWLKDPQVARELIRKSVEHANKRVWFFDPYFGDLELLWFAHDIPISAEIRIVTSKEAFQTTDLSSPHDATDDPTEDIAELAKEGDRLDRKSEKLEKEKLGLASFSYQLKQLKNSSPDQKIEAYIMSGSPPPLHDRFLIVDNSIRLMGNSFGTAGKREGVMISLPDYESAEKELLRIFDTTFPFEVYAAKRIRQLVSAIEKTD